MSAWIDVGAVDDWRDGDYRLVDVDGEPVAVYRLYGGFHAVEDVCTHDGGELAGGPIEGYAVECPRHGARFDLRTGAVLSPPAYRPIRVYAVRIEAGRVQVRSAAD